MLSGLTKTLLSWSRKCYHHCKTYVNLVLSESFVLKNLTHAGTTVSSVTMNQDSIYALRGTKSITISCAITLNTNIGPDYSALNVTWTHNGSKYGQAGVLQSTPSGEASTEFTSVLTIDSNEFSTVAATVVLLQ